MSIVDKFALAVCLATGLAIACCPNASAKTEKMPSVWVSQPIQIDGKFTDWPDTAGILLPEQKAYLGITNDQNYLYLLFRTRDPRWARTIKISGLTFYADPKGGKNKDFFVRFKGGPTREEIRAMSGNNPDMMRDRRPEGQRERRGGMRGGMPQGDLDEMAVDSAPKLTCFIKDRIIEKEIPLDGAEGPSAAFDTSQGFFVYEFRVPLSEGNVRTYGLGVEPGKQISVGCVWGEMLREREPDHRPSFDMGGMPEGGGMEGGMGGPPDMGRPGGMGRPEKQEVWVKTTLATPSAPKN